MFTTGKLRLSKEEMKKLKARLTQLRSSSPVWGGGPMAPPGPRPPGPEMLVPQGMGMLRGDVQASERRSVKPLGGGVKPPRDAGETSPF